MIEGVWPINLESEIALTDINWHQNLLIRDDDSDDIVCAGNGSLRTVPKSILYFIIVLGVSPTVAVISILAVLLLWLLLLDQLVKTGLLFYLLLTVKASADLLLLTLWLVSDLLDSCPYICPFSSSNQLYHYKSVFYAKIYYPVVNASCTVSIYMLVAVTVLWSVILFKSVRRRRCILQSSWKTCGVLCCVCLVACGLNLPKVFCLGYICRQSQLVPVSSHNWCNGVYKWLSLCCIQFGPLLALVSLSGYLIRQMTLLARTGIHSSLLSSGQCRSIVLMNLCFMLGQVPDFVIQPDPSQPDWLQLTIPESTRTVVIALINCLEAASYTVNLLILTTCDSRFQATLTCAFRRSWRRWRSIYARKS